MLSPNIAYKFLKDPTYSISWMHFLSPTGSDPKHRWAQVSQHKAATDTPVPPELTKALQLSGP